MNTPTHRLLVESDCLEAVNLINNRRNYDGVPSIVHSIVEVLDRLWCVRISHIGRDGNYAADWMAKLFSSDYLMCHRYLSPPAEPWLPLLLHLPPLHLLHFLFILVSLNTNSGGHAVIGFYFAKELLGSGHEKITRAGGKTMWGDPADVGNVVAGATFDVVLDNNGKDLDTVSSAGIYKPTDEPPHVEGDVVKADAGHVGVEKYIAEVFGRPQYMIGSGNNKDCEEWFFDRNVRNRPVPIPGSGMQLTNIAHVRDLSSMLTLAVEKPEAASCNIFNCVSDRAVTLDGMARLCAEAAGLPVEIVHHDPKAVGIDAKKAFPFRNMHVYAEPRAAKDILGWEGTTNLQEDLKERFKEYVKIGRDKKPMQFEMDDKILEALKVPLAV
ncbi:hypothetical protein GQ457_01G053220 [Hibiscus cannabinus]